MVDLSCNDRKRLSEASLGKIVNDKVFRNIKILNVFTKQWILAHVYVYKKWISHVEYDVNKEILDCKQIINGDNLYLSPAFVDSHTHIESSLLTPLNYAKLVVPHGTLTVLEDAHEIANVCGEEGLKYMLESNGNIPMRQLLTIPSCVPSVPNLENSGATFDYSLYRTYLEKDYVVGLGEVMDYEGVLCSDERITKILDEAKNKKVYIQGHAPLLQGNRLSAYLCNGIKSDHEARGVQEVIEKYRQGMWIDIRDANTNHNMPKIIEALSEIGNYDRVAFSSDDRRCDVISRKGHIDGIIRHAHSCGMPLIEAYISATYRPCLEVNIGNLGAIAPGYIADFNVLDDIENVHVKDVYFEGKCVVKNGNMISHYEDTREALNQTVNIPDLDETNFFVYSKGSKVTMNVIKFESFSSSITNLIQQAFPIKNGKVELSPKGKYMFVSVINRYNKGTHTLGVVENFGINHGAIASTVGHDAHNVTVVYDNPQNAIVALRQLKKQKGGFCAVESGCVIASMPLSIAGLMSNKNVADVVNEINNMNEANVKLGNIYIENPLSRITILSLLVCPYVKISDEGIVLTEEKKTIPLISEVI